MNDYKRKFEDEMRKLGEAERKADVLDIEKKSVEKQNEIQRKQLLDKIVQQNEQIAAEKDTREIWINRYEKEQKAHILTHTELLKIKGELHETSLAYENVKTQASTLENAKISLQ